MTEDQIPDFIDDILATGSPICAIGDDLYVLGELDVLGQDMERVSRGGTQSASGMASATI